MTWCCTVVPLCYFIFSMRCLTSPPPEDSNPLTVVAVVSKEGEEEVELLEPLPLEGAPEKWIPDVLNAVSRSLVKYLVDAYETVASRSRDSCEWIFEFPVQVAAPITAD
jgi:hypothetical protein